MGSSSQDLTCLGFTVSVDVYVVNIFNMFRQDFRDFVPRQMLLNESHGGSGVSLSVYRNLATIMNSVFWCIGDLTPVVFQFCTVYE